MSENTRMGGLMALSGSFNAVCDKATTAYQQCKADNGGDPTPCMKENEQMSACFATLYVPLPSL